MAFGPFKTAQALADALRAREVTPLRIQKALRHCENDEERAAVAKLLHHTQRKAFQELAAQPRRRRR